MSEGLNLDKIVRSCQAAVNSGYFNDEQWAVVQILRTSIARTEALQQSHDQLQKRCAQAEKSARNLAARVGETYQPGKEK